MSRRSARRMSWLAVNRPGLNGKPHLVHVWATWCGPCKNDLPLLKRFSDSGGIVVGIQPGGTDETEVAAAIKDAELSYPTYFSPQATSIDEPAIAGYPATIYPYCLLIDGKGNVAAHGSLRDNEFDVFARYRELVEDSDEASSEATESSEE